VGSLAIHRHDGLAAADLAMRSRVVFANGPMLAEAELVVSVPRDEAIVLGSFQRGSEVSSDLPIVRRGSGGAACRVGPGSVWVQLFFSSLEVPPDKILNRLVRPLLRAMTKTGAHAHYFGRDWVSVDHRPAAMVAQ
jgi:lipoate-protein ligase A